jgi:FK506-binding protein 4/5
MTIGEDVTTSEDGGVIKVIKRAGDPNGDLPWKGDRVSVHYVGTLEDGSQFDSSRDRAEHFTFNLGKGEVIKGWDLGVATMKIGELAEFTVKSEYGYGSAGSLPKIPGGATLVFEVELFDFQGEDITPEKNKGVVKRIKNAGEGFDTPNDGSTVEVNLKGSTVDGGAGGGGGQIFEERTALSFMLGEGLEAGVPRGVELALEKMKKKESCQVTLQPSYGFGGGDAAKGVPAMATLRYEIELVSFERAKESWSLDGEQKLEQAKIFKEKGTKFFREEKYELAEKKYAKIVEFLEHEISLKDAAEDERKSLLEAGRMNLAMCHLKKLKFFEARDVCDKVIEINPDNAKAFFRRGEAYISLKDYEKAKEDYARCLALDRADNKAAHNKVALCNRHLKAQREKERKTFANMFDKFAKIDAQKEAVRRSAASADLEKMEINEFSDEVADGSGSAAAAAGDAKHTETNGGSSTLLDVKGDIDMNIDLEKAMEEDVENVQRL